mmetsp:Transcript_37793/g.103875  ORF Transcript_37793/g.103875 Transcript_37793/m.103875 type:complete len:245 (+) Transcript_37793:956-1690(+)
MALLKAIGAWPKCTSARKTMAPTDIHTCLHCCGLRPAFCRSEMKSVGCAAESAPARITRLLSSSCSKNSVTTSRLKPPPSTPTSSSSITRHSPSSASSVHSLIRDWEMASNTFSRWNMRRSSTRLPRYSSRNCSAPLSNALRRPPPVSPSSPRRRKNCNGSSAVCIATSLAVGLPRGSAESTAWSRSTRSESARSSGRQRSPRVGWYGQRETSSRRSKKAFAMATPQEYTSTAGMGAASMSPTQ